MPSVDTLAVEYQGSADVIAVAWQSSQRETAAAAARLLPSGAVRWMLDEDEDVFARFGVVYQPVSVLVDRGVEIGRWFGPIPIPEVRSLLDQAIRA